MPRNLDCSDLLLASVRKPRFEIAFLALLTAALGCGNTLSSVSGTLTLDGKPLAASDTVHVTIMFYPEGGGAPASARVDSSGRYELATGAAEGIAEGRYVAIVSAIESAGGAAKSLTPEKYADPKQSGLAIEVRPGNNTFDFELKSKP